MGGVSAWGQTITVNSVSDVTICQGGVIIVDFTSVGQFNPDNDYTVQLSDATGTYTSPIDIGTIANQVAGNFSLETTNIVTPKWDWW